MKILFLDFDGVLGPSMFDPRIRNEKYGENWKSERLEHIAAQDQIARVIRETGCKIVFSTSWRHGHTLEELSDYLFENNIIESTDQAIDMLSTFEIDEHPLQRGDYIKEWLGTHDNVDSFAIVDDLNYATWLSKKSDGRLMIHKTDEKLFNRFVKTESRVGCTKENADMLIELLNG